MRKYMKILALAGLFTVLLCGSALAAEEYTSGAGFYNVKSSGQLTIAAVSTTGTTVEKVSANVDRDTNNTYEDFQKGTDALTVTVKNTNSANQYLVVLAGAAADETLTANSEIYYIDQKAGTGGNMDFDVLPKLPGTGATPMKVFVTSDDETFTMQQAALGYADGENFRVAPYVLGDINGDGKWNSADALTALQIGAGKVEYTQTEWLAANVNNQGASKDRVNSADALDILLYGAGKLSSFNV